MTANEAFVTLSTNDTYCLGALVLGHSLRNVNTTRTLVILITSSVSQRMRNILSTVFDVVKEVNLIDSKDETILALMKRPELGVTLTKLHCWQLTEYSKCVFLDADCLVLKNIDELFEKEELSAVADIGWPDCFNTGVFVFRPSQETFSQLVALLAKDGSFDGGDQGLLNMYFSDWAHKDISKHLSFIYNMSSLSVYSYLPAYKQFGANVKVVHFIGSMKPWMYGYNANTGEVKTPPFCRDVQALEHISLWWQIFMSKVQPQLSPECSGLAADLSRLKIGEGSGEYQGSSAPVDDKQRRANWESGNVDYLGADRFENIQKKLDEAISKPK
ncbi:glycogenin-1-like protein [Dinothrombium tinctorium]|uniref:glycogenin glucosyltransferase n=1 Tax=Dinothrombium tinctorium TaxID=1965070 RepID=A0A443QS41_9ACAR|nr:glycogenin-1-like protein [Dinothrombium tinctorium]